MLRESGDDLCFPHFAGLSKKAELTYLPVPFEIWLSSISDQDRSEIGSGGPGQDQDRSASFSKDQSEQLWDRSCMSDLFEPGVSNGYFKNPDCYFEVDTNVCKLCAKYQELGSRGHKTKTGVKKEGTNRARHLIKHHNMKRCGTIWRISIFDFVIVLTDL